MNYYQKAVEGWSTKGGNASIRTVSSRCNVKSGHYLLCAWLRAGFEGKKRRVSPVRGSSRFTRAVWYSQQGVMKKNRTSLVEMITQRLACWCMCLSAKEGMSMAEKCNYIMLLPEIRYTFVWVSDEGQRFRVEELMEPQDSSRIRFIKALNTGNPSG